MSRQERVLLTPLGNRLHLHARDQIRAVQIDRLVSEVALPVAPDPSLALFVRDEADLVLWREDLSSFVRPGNPVEAIIGKTFAVWDQLTIGLQLVTQDGAADAVSPLVPESVDFRIQLYYTINPETTFSDQPI